ncbi:MFS transporter [Bacillus sp. AFS076308]|uniref:multidrug effflux MFS transporter n=1 Tax=unclassified Bacillus (in: firmicutes) TaxID=185979 RepID=UPI000BF6FF62|nr:MULTISPECIES: multidrug effflux MFS transporter [unclassified Bacillus (in: firmicutes)]PFO06609.1 MFS transporter [Bacillus sp. AFS076308]PGV52838.1 MFS transporter [Bacillus sp. AFS037270]
MNVKASKHQLSFALMLAVFCALGPFTVDMYLSSFPQIMNSFGTNASMVQMSLTASILGLSIGQMVNGTLSDVHGRRKPLLISMFLYFISSIGCAFAPNIQIFIALRFIQGFVASAGLVISRAIVRDLYSGVELTKFFALLSTITSVTPLLSPLAGSAVTSFTSWIGVFIFTGLLGIYLTIITSWKIKETLPVDKRIQSNYSELLNNYKKLIFDRTFMGYALVSGIIFAGVFAYVSGSPFIYQKVYGVSPQVFSLLFALNGISLMLAAQLTKYLAGRMSPRHIFLIGLWYAFIASLAVLIVVLFHGPLVALVISLFLFNSSNGIIGPISFTLAMESQGHIAGTASALLGILPFLLGSVASPLVGIAGEYSALPLGVIIFTTSLLAVFFNGVLIKKGKVVASTSKKISNV